MAKETAPNRYDEVPYPTGAFDQTHPNRLATLATLFGMNAPAVETCRVLELGCGSGGNILPMALSMPRAGFVGIDYSAREIEEGLPWIERLGLSNMTLKHEDILDFTIEPESFDYIIAHGVFSWVPRPVQDRLLEICGRALAKNGVAYVSYNVFPGCHVRRMVRDIMRFHTRATTDPAARAAQARSVIGFAAGAVPPNNPLYATILKGELERITKMSDEVLFHDDLAEINEPFYFHQFVERASEHGLKFLSEALFADMQDQIYPAHAREALRRSGDIIAAEQYMDFLSCRAFRQTLLCRADVALNRQLTPANIRAFFVASNSAPLSASPDVRGASVEKFKNAAGVVVGMDQPISKAAMVHLAAIAPQPITFDELLEAAIERAGHDGGSAQARAEDEETLGEAMLSAFSGNMVELSVSRARFATEPGERPRASELARLQAESGNRITSLTHKNIVIDDPFALEVLKRLNGERDRAALVDELSALVVAGELEIGGGGRIEDPEAARRAAAEKLPQTLERMARFGLLAAPRATTE